MVEWGNYWAKAIKLRDYQHTEAYMGLFSQIGELYNVKVGAAVTIGGAACNERTITVPL